MNQGTVKFFNNDKGFGFIKDDESNTEYFVHVTGLVDQIEEGDSVEFELTNPSSFSVHYHSSYEDAQ